MMQAQWQPNTQSGEQLSFPVCKGGFISASDSYGLAVKGMTLQDGTATPTAPLPIRCVAAGSVIRIGGKNHLILPERTLTRAGVTVVYDEAKQTVTIHGTVNADALSFPINDMELAICPNTVYTLSIHPVSGSLTDRGGGTTGLIALTLGASEEPGRYENWLRAELNGSLSATASSVGHRYITRAWVYLRSPVANGFVFDHFRFRYQLEVSPIPTAYDVYRPPVMLTSPCDLYRRDVWYPVTGKVERHNEIFDSYAGEPLQNGYYASTGYATFGSTVVSPLLTPKIEQYAPHPIATHPGTVVVNQIPRDLTATLTATMLTRRM